MLGKNTLFNQLLLSHLSLVFICVMGIGGFTLLTIKSNAHNDLNYYLNLEARDLSAAMTRKDVKSTERILNDLSNRGFWLILFDSTQKIEYASRPTQEVEYKNHLQVIDTVMTSGKSATFELPSGGKNWHMAVIPHFNAQGQVSGAISLGLPLINFNRELGDTFFTLLSLGLLIAIVTVFVIWSLSQWVERPIKLIARQAQIIASTGELDFELPIFKSEEVGELAKSFNLMIKKLREEKKFQKDFIANASHELKTPIMAIGSAVEIITDEQTKQADRAHFLAILNRQTLRLKELIHDLLDVSQLENGRVELMIRECQLVSFLESAVVDVEVLASNAKVDFSWYAEQRITFACDSAKLRRALTNLLSNAIKHTPPGGEVLLTSQLVVDETVNSQALLISVKDTGSGIAPEEQSKIFSRFYRSQDDRSRETGGSGLGLTIAKQIVELHGGELSVKSKLGEGSEFTIWLPMRKIL